MNTSPQSIVLRLAGDIPVDDRLMAEWGSTVAAAGPSSKIMVDASGVPPLREADLRLISRHLCSLARGKHCELLMICPRETEALVGQMGLDRVIKCFQVHTKHAPEPKVKAEELGSEKKKELALFFAHLAGCLQRISGQLFGLEMSYQPPLEILTGTPESNDAIREYAITRAESDCFTYTVVFAVGQKEKAIFAEKLFKGLKVPADALRDLLPEFVNNTMGSVVSQLSMSTPSVTLKSRIPEPCTRDVACESLRGSSSKVRLQFRHDQLTMSIIVGYGVK